jgi:hypothetical protein
MSTTEEQIQIIVRQLQETQETLRNQQEYLAALNTGATQGTNNPPDPELIEMTKAPVMHFPVPDGFQGSGASFKYEAVPEYFGVCKKLEEFLFQCDLFFIAHPQGFPNDSAKIIYATSRLRGEALKWVMPYLQTSPDLQDTMLTNWVLFKARMVKYFGDPHKKAKASNLLLKLKQGSKPMREHVSEFRRLVMDAGWVEEDAAVGIIFYNSLKVEVQDQFVNHDIPNGFSEYVELALRVENRLEEHRARKRLDEHIRYAKPAPRSDFRPYAPAVKPPPQVQPRSEPTIQGPVPMEVDTAHVHPPGRLTMEERQRRLANRLCFYCNEPGHRVEACPIRPPRRSINAIETVVSDSNSGNVQTQ